MTDSPVWPRCSFVAEAAGDAHEGSAPPAEQWFLVEHPGPWGPRSPTGSDIAPEALAALSGWAEEVGARVVLVRRPGREVRGRRARRWFRVDSRAGHESIRTGEFTADAELAAAVRGPGEPFDGPLHLVCAHGRHDTCCAVRGRPVAASLAARSPGRTWECSHIGGCRFAPVLVLLPHGYALGHVAAPEAPEIVEDYRAGRVPAHRVRGRTSLPPAAQAAQHHARMATGSRGVDDLRLVRAELEGDAYWRVELASPGCTVLLRERWVDADRPLTCAATAAGRARAFDLVELRR